MRRKTKPRGAAGKPSAEIGIIGGSGLYEMPGLESAREVRIRTPFGDPSDAFVIGTLEGRRVAFLSRHGRGHRILPSGINYRANIYAMKMLGVQRIISISAVGSLKENVQPMEFLIPDQFYDRTKLRVATFFGEGLVAHVSFDRPVCPQLAVVLGDACSKAGVKTHRGGIYVCMEGPQFSTLAEANVNRAHHFDVIGMTNVTEAKLAREAEVCYATVAMVTDFDCWHPDHDSVTLEQIMNNLSRNTANAQNTIRAAVKAMPVDRTCKCGSALAHALVTDPKMVPAATKRKLAAIVGRYLK
jgi:5'-methylthioadenosine phosphorylase